MHLNKKDALRPQYMSKSSHSGNDRAINKHGQFLRFTSRAFHSKQKNPPFNPIANVADLVSYLNKM